MTDFLEKHTDKLQHIAMCGCMIWMGSTTDHGYGKVWTGKRTPAGNKFPEGAHRASFEAAHGPIPDGKHVLHRCDIRSCVNPDHLFLGDQDTNMKDMAAKGRSCLGERHGMAKMTEEHVLRIRAEYRFRRVTAQMLADKYNLPKPAVAAAIRRDTWTHI
jgi:hypothetical protein